MTTLKGKGKKTYQGEIGELWQVNYLPSYMMGWPDWKIKIGCWLFNHWPWLERKLYGYRRF